MQWWRTLNTPRGVFWSRVVSALVMVIFGTVVLLVGDHDHQIIGAGAFFIALINASMAIGQWTELKSTK